MEWQFSKDPTTLDRVFYIRISDRDIMSMRRPDYWDNALFGECERSDRVSDKLLALERMVRLIEEGYEPWEYLADWKY